jgi:two-component system response regulator FixJ
MTSGRTIHVVDDDEAMRHSLVALLEDAGHEARSYASAEDLLACGAPDPGCVVSDIRMPGMDGLTLLKKLRAERSELPLILITGHGDIPLAVAAMKAGAVDFLEKPFEAEALLSAIEASLRRPAHPSPPGEASAVAVRCLETLTAREREVLERLVAGESNKEAAMSMGISHRTVEFHRAHIMEKTGAKGLPDLVRLWVAAGS